MEQGKVYDYIIAGAGAAGLSLAYHLLIHPHFCQKQILIIDRFPKVENDRTWCFWETQPGLFESCVVQKWEHLKLASKEWSGIVDTQPYSYKMIQSDEFYKFCWAKIKKFSNVDVVLDTIKSIGLDDQVVCEKNIFNGNKVFNSALFHIPKNNKRHHLLQHFKGWYVNFEYPVLDPKTATLMDFDIEQSGDCRFIYLLPLSKTKALVEYTVFSKTLLPEDKYDDALLKYLNDKFPNQKYNIENIEFGVIPMTNATINSAHNGSAVISIGTAGYASKASTGYTFGFIQRQCRQIIKYLENEHKSPLVLKPSAKFQFYDAVLLNVISTGKYEGWKIFTRLFKRLPAPLVLRFLNEETEFLQDLRIISSVNIWQFTKAAVQELKAGLKK